MRGDKHLADLLKIKHPIIQAPMAGGMTTVDLVCATSQAGGLGSFGAAYMKPDELRQAVREVKSRGTASYQVNLFAPVSAAYEPARHKAALDRLRDIYALYGLDFAQASDKAHDDFVAQIDVLIEEKVPCVSFAFGMPEAVILDALRAEGCVLMGTATCVDEAKQLANAKFDAIVAQGFEAGGHRCTFHTTLEKSPEIPNIGLFALIPQIAAQVDLPVIAAGGIMDGKGIKAAMTLGAAGAQLGTAFMACPETKITTSWHQALMQAADTDTALTKAFSGRYARGIRNAFMEQMQDVAENVPPFPAQNALTGLLRGEARKRDDAGYQSLWAGQAAGMARAMPAAELVQTLAHEMEEDYSAARRSLSSAEM